MSFHQPSVWGYSPFLSWNFEGSDPPCFSGSSPMFKEILKVQRSAMFPGFTPPDVISFQKTLLGNLGSGALWSSIIQRPGHAIFCGAGCGFWHSRKMFFGMWCLFGCYFGLSVSETGRLVLVQIWNSERKPSQSLGDR